MKLDFFFNFILLQLFYLLDLSLFFLLLFVLFEIIYEIWFFFNFILLQLFLSIKFSFYFFITICFILNYLWNLVFFSISFSFSFFICQIWNGIIKHWKLFSNLLSMKLSKIKNNLLSRNLPFIGIIFFNKITTFQQTNKVNYRKLFLLFLFFHTMVNCQEV